MPEPLRHVLAGCWTRRTDEERRLVDLVEAQDVFVLQGRFSGMSADPWPEPLSQYPDG